MKLRWHRDDDGRPLTSLTKKNNNKNKCNDGHHHHHNNRPNLREKTGYHYYLVSITLQ